jgi:FMN phosphatase YigB (HAD superfamily)
MENMFAAKPHPAYYEHVLTEIGCEPQEVLMVGDDMANDIMPASSLGCHTFWLDKDQHPDTQIPTESGTLAELFAKLQAGWLQ